MFTLKTRQKTLAQLEAELNQEILNGNALAAFEKFYADDVIMQENDAEPTVGKAANRQRENDFFAAITEFRGMKLLSSAASDDTTFSHWHMDYTHRDWGSKTYRQVSVRTWKDGKIISEVFHYG